jgi:hypothetical protein
VNVDIMENNGFLMFLILRIRGPLYGNARKEMEERKERTKIEKNTKVYCIEQC